MVKVLIQQQNPEFNNEDIQNMLSRFLRKEHSASVPQSSASTHVPNFNRVKILFNYEYVTNMCKIVDTPGVVTCFTPCCHGFVSFISINWPLSCCLYLLLYSFRVCALFDTCYGSKL